MRCCIAGEAAEFKEDAAAAVEASPGSELDGDDTTSKETSVHQRMPSQAALKTFCTERRVEREAGELGRSRETFVFTRWSRWLAQRKRRRRLDYESVVNHERQLLLWGMTQLRQRREARQRDRRAAAHARRRTASIYIRKNECYRHTDMFLLHARMCPAFVFVLAEKRRAPQTALSDNAARDGVKKKGGNKDRSRRAMEARVRTLERTSDDAVGETRCHGARGALFKRPGFAALACFSSSQ